MCLFVRPWTSTREMSQFKYEVFLQGSFKNDTNLGRDSDVDVVIRLASKLKPSSLSLLY